MKQYTTNKKIDLPLSIFGGGLYFTPVWLQKTGMDPRTCTNDTR